MIHSSRSLPEAKERKTANDFHCTGVMQKLLTAGEKWARHVQVDVAGFELELDSRRKYLCEALKSIEATAGRLMGGIKFACC